MDKLNEIIYVLVPWICFLGVIFLFSKLIDWARKRKGAVIAVGVFIQMFLPDPNVEKTIQVVVEQKQQQLKKSDENACSDPDNGEKG